MQINKKIIIIIAVLILVAVGVYFVLKRDIKNNTTTEIATSTDIITTTTEDVTINDDTDFYSIIAVYPKDPKDNRNLIEESVLKVVNLKKQEWGVDGELYNAEKKLEEAKDDLEDEEAGFVGV